MNSNNGTTDKKRQQKVNMLLLILSTAIIFGLLGFSIGRVFSHNSINDNADQNVSTTNVNQDAYSKGWTYWFIDWGSHHEGLQYIDQYIYGRHYGETFASSYEAFEAGYKDAFFHCNHSDPDEYFIEKMKKGYQEYFGNN